tara:strand:+ start:5356 stop:6306 length:951 start_codon:yes stop_codon:yes gene_type:complete
MAGNTEIPLNNLRAAGPEDEDESIVTISVVDAENDQPEFMYVGAGAINRYWELPFLEIDGNDSLTEPADLTYTFDWPAGWIIFSIPLDPGTITSIEYNGTTLNITESDRTMQYHGYNNYGNTYTTTSESTHNQKVAQGYTTFAEKTIAMDKFFELLVNDNKVIIVKNYLGAAFLPEFNFNGIGRLNPNWGYQLKLEAPVSMTITGKPHFSVDQNSNSITLGRIIYFTDGWNMPGWPMIDFNLNNPNPQTATDFEASMEDFLEAQTADGSLIIAKDYLGAAYLPEYNFNGIGNGKSGQGYQIKFLNYNYVHVIDCTY